MSGASYASLPRSIPTGSDLLVSNPYTRRVGVDILLLDQFDLGDLAALTEVFHLANTDAKWLLFEIRCMGLDSGSIESSSGLSIAVASDIGGVVRSDNLIVLGGADLNGAKLVAACGVLRRCFKIGARIGAIGVAAKLLMEAGLMRDRSVAGSLGILHAWREMFPEIDLTEQIYHSDGSIFTCCGGSATIDLALQVVQDYLGQGVMLHIAERFNLSRVRTSTDTQIAAPLMLARRQANKLQQAIELLRRPEDVNRTSRDIAGKLKISQRQVQRLFNRHLNARPHEYARRCRLERAKQLIVHSRLSVTEIAMATGFVSASHFSRRYRMHFGVSPTADRKRCS